MNDLEIKRLVRPMVREIAPYRSARDEFEDFGAQKIFMDANENPYNTDTNRYPDPLQHKLKRVLAKIKGVSDNQILLGNGSDEVLDLIFRTFCEPGNDEVILLPPTYGMYGVLAQLNSVKVVDVPLDENFELDLAAIMSSVNEKTKLIIVCSPNKPSGNAIPLLQIQSLLDQFSGLVVVDEAYVDFSEGGTALDLLEKYPRLIICQTFSKAYGMAGIRLGIGFAHPTVIDFFNKIKPPYNVNVLTQRKALSVFNLTDVLERQVRELIGERKKMKVKLLSIGFVKKIYPSDANFLLVLVDDAKKRYDQFLEQGIVVRSRSSLLGCANTLRVTIGTPKENITFINACKTLDQL